MITRFLNWLLRRTTVTITRGVYVFCGWANPNDAYGKVPGVQCPTPNPWTLKTQDRKPQLGYYDEKEPSVTAWRCEMMAQGAVDFAVYQIGWSFMHSNLDKLPLWDKEKGFQDPLLYAHCAHAHIAASPRFCLSFFDVVADDTYWNDRVRDGWTREDVLKSFDRLAAEMNHLYIYSKRAYFTRNGKPVVFWGYPQNLTYYKRFGITPEEIIKLFTTYGLFMVATAVEPGFLPYLKDWGFSALTEYLWYADSWDAVVQTYRAKWEEYLTVAEANGLEFWVPATSGYDSTAWGAPVVQRFIPTGEQFKAHMKEARSFAKKHARVTKGMIVAYAWNEFGEGGIIEPLAEGGIHAGDEMLRAFAAS